MNNTINFRPVHLTFNRYVRLAAGILCVVLTANIGLSANSYVKARLLAEQIKESSAYSEINSLSASVIKASEERKMAESLLEALSEPVTEPAPDIIFNTAKNLHVNILVIDGQRVTGYVSRFETAAEFINALSKELGKEVRIINISRLELDGGATGFELEI